MVVDHHEMPRSGGGTTQRRFVLQWLRAVGMVGLVAMVPASILGFIAAVGPGGSTLFSLAGVLGLWFVLGGLCGGTAIAIQQTFHQPRVTAPLFAAGIVVLLSAVIWGLVTLTDPRSYMLYVIAVAAPFVVFVVPVLTLAAVLIPAEKWKPVATVAAAIALIVSIASRAI